MSKHRQVVLLMALILSSWSTSVELRAQTQSTTDSPEVAKLVRQGNDLLDNGNHESALKKFESADATAEGGSFGALMGLAHTYRLLFSSSKHRGMLLSLPCRQQPRDLCSTLQTFKSRLWCANSSTPIAPSLIHSFGCGRRPWVYTAKPLHSTAQGRVKDAHPG